MKNIILLLFVIQLPLNIRAQTEFSGIISDYYGVLFDAHILNKNTKQGTISDAKGSFSIGAKKNDTLVISYVGYKIINLVVSNFKSQSVHLEIDETLNEVLVIAQDVKRERIRLSGCSWNSKSEEEYESEQLTFRCEVQGVKITAKIMPIVEENILLYPNPSKSGIFNLKLDKLFNSYEIEVSTMSGQLILKQDKSRFSKQIKIDLSNYPKGIYILNYRIDGESQRSKKVIIG